jgi:hypothetical protein
LPPCDWSGVPRWIQKIWIGELDLGPVTVWWKHVIRVAGELWQAVGT